MKTKLKKNINYFPYKIFQRNQTNPNSKLNKIADFNSVELFPQHKKVVIDISKNLKSVAISSKLFTDYMDNYSYLTRDFCFKSPDKKSYPIRKNLKFLSAISIKNINDSNEIEKKKILKRPKSSNINFYKNKLINFSGEKSRNKKFKIKNFDDIIKRNNKNNLLYSTSESKFKVNKNLMTHGNNINSSIDLDNHQNIKNENFEYLKQYMNNKNYENDNLEKSELKKINNLSNKNIQYELNIYSICLKFKILNNSKLIKQKLNLKFRYLPLFYLLDYQTFKVFLSEIIYYDNKINNFKFIEKNLDEIYNKYCQYINNNDLNNDITFYKNEFRYSSLYNWFVYNSKINNENKNIIFELQIEFPKIIFNIINCETKIKYCLKKNLLIQLMKKEFLNWEELILSELYFVREFRYIINSILTKQKKFLKKNINLSKNNNINNNDIENISKNFQFFMSEINEKRSNYYIFNPYVITLKRRNNEFSQEIHLTLKESRTLYKFGKYWGIMNTLLKCININEITNLIDFKFDLLNGISPNYFHLNKSQIKDKKEYMKFKFNKIDILISDCCLKKIIINNTKEEKYIKIPQKFLKIILNYKESHKNNLLIQNNINEFCKEIKDEKEIDIKKRHFTKRNDDNATNESIDRLLVEKKKTLNLNKTNSNINNINININENENENENDNDNELNNNKIKVNASYNTNKDNNNLFLTKDYINNNEVQININKNKINNFINKKDENEKNNIINNNKNISNYKNRNSCFINNTLYLIHNQRDLEKNRTLRDSCIYNQDIDFNKLQKTLLNLNKKININNKE